MTLARVVQERVFLPYTPYMESAKHFCEELTRKDYVSWHDLLAATTLFERNLIFLLRINISYTEPSCFSLIYLHLNSHQYRIVFSTGSDAVNRVARIRP